MNIKNIIFQKSYKNLQAFGLDISDSSIKIAQLKKSGNGFKLISHNRVSIPSGIIKEGEIEKDQELVDLIKKTIKEIKGKKLKSNYAICSLPEQHSFIKIIQMPKMTMAELESAIKWEAEANIPFPLNEVYMDWQIIKQEDNIDHFDILINAVPKKIIDKYLEVLRKADIEPIVFETESIASIRSLIKNEFANKPVLIIDLGFNRTSFNVFSDHSIRFTSSIPVSNNQMIQEISKQMGISWDDAKVLKFKIGLNKEKDKGKIFNILLSILTKLAENIKDCVSFYEQHDDEHEENCPDKVSKIILCGGGANLFGIAEYLSLWLKLPVVLGNPWINIFCSNKKKSVNCQNESKFPELSYEESLSYSTVLGLALRGINSKNI
ncbi:MAG: type IV pilus assembly protein PilM [Patescibacteria group bacterium]